MRTPKILVLLASTMLAGAAHAAAPAEIAVVGPRVHLSDIVKTAAKDAGEIDLGPVPSVGGSRVIGRAEIITALHERGAEPPASLPVAVRVVRKMTQLSADDIDHAIRDALASSKMPRGATLAAVRAPRTLDVPEGYTSTRTELPRPPRRSGPFSTSVTLSFMRGDEVLARANVPIELTLSAEAATFDVTKGATIVLLIKRGLVEITVPATVGADADIGSTLPIVLRPSGRVIQAHLNDKDHATSLEGT